MASIKRFEDLEIWIEARRLSKEIILISKTTELNKDFKLKDQIKSSSGSVMDNIAEGFERNGNGEFRQFFLLQKVLLENLVHNYIEFLTMNILMSKN